MPTPGPRPDDAAPDDDGAEPASDEPMLSHAARQRLELIAAELIGRLPSEEVPARLKRFATFAPAKRARLGGAAFTAAIDSDGQFRGRVAEVVTESAPELVAALRDGTPTTDFDPVDVAVVAYVVRPDGWQGMVAAANARHAEQDGTDGAVARERDRLRADLAAARAALRGHTARVKEEVAAAVAQVEAHAADLRRQLRTRTRDLREAERARDVALAALEELQRHQRAEESARDAETRRLRARITELERAGEAARRDARAGRDLDDARLWLLVETVTDAAAGIRRELSLPPPGLRPADTVTGAAERPPTRRAADPALLDRLLALPDVHLLVDGYNITKTGYPDLSLADQRARLVGSLAALAARSGAEVTVAFDGGTRPPAQQAAPRGVRVLFSEADEIADDLIRRLVDAEPPGRPVVVVTSDQQIVTDVLAVGAWAVPSAVFLTRLG